MFRARANAGTDLDDFIQAQIKSPDEDILKASIDEASYYTFTDANEGIFKTFEGFVIKIA